MTNKMDQHKDKTLRFMDKGRFVRVDYNYVGSEKRDKTDRRNSLRGDPGRSDSGEEQRVGSRRLNDLVITIQIKDDKGVYVNASVFKEIVKKMLQSRFPDICSESEPESLMSISFSAREVFVETKMKYRDGIKQLIIQKGLSFEVVDNGVYIGTGSEPAIKQKQGIKQKQSIKLEQQEMVPGKESGISAILGYTRENIQDEINNIIFKVFLKCLNEVHPVSGDYERDALKQNVSLEQRIIFLAGKHYPKTEKYTFETIIEQVFAECIKAYNGIIQLEAEVHGLEERYRLHSDSGLKTVIDNKHLELEQVKNSSLEETIRTLYLYLDYFKDLIKVGSIKGRIENVFKKVNDKQIKILSLDKIYQQLKNVLDIEKQIKSRKPENYAKLLGYIEWLKNEVNTEVYFVRFLWINNLRGETYIDDAVERTLKAISS
jgi:hypothetical protein